MLPLGVSAALLGHPAAVTQVPLLALGVDATHVLGAGGWAGTIVVIAMAALPQLLRMPHEHRLPLVRSMLRAFTPLALTCAVMLVLTGAASALLQLGNLWLVFSSDYGSILVRKVVLVLLMAVLGAYHWRIAQPFLTTERSFTLLRRSLAVDVALVLMILILTSILTGTAVPPR
jgi:putative copper export protein